MLKKTRLIMLILVLILAMNLHNFYSLLDADPNQELVYSFFGMHVDRIFMVDLTLYCLIGLQLIVIVLTLGDK